MIKRIFFLVSFSWVFASPGQNADIDLLRRINQERNRPNDGIFELVSNSVAPVCIAVPAGYITAALIRKDSATRAKAFIVTSSVVVSGVVTLGLKYAVNRPRPFVTYPGLDNTAVPGTPSFPSQHTSEAFALATSVSTVCPKWYVIVPSFIWACTVGYSRMRMGVHYPSDVLGGALVGGGSTFLSIKLNKWINHPHRR
jgi:membrane-associated phospholipid phosphatase